MDKEESHRRITSVVFVQISNAYAFCKFTSEADRNRVVRKMTGIKEN